jgi:hypothetical protein
LANSISEARDLMHDESIRAGPAGIADPGALVTLAITDSDIAARKAKFPFLREFSDGFIKANKPDCLTRMETTNMKLKEAK